MFWKNGRRVWGPNSTTTAGRSFISPPPISPLSACVLSMFSCLPPVDLVFEGDSPSYLWWVFESQERCENNSLLSSLITWLLIEKREKFQVAAVTPSNFVLISRGSIKLAHHNWTNQTIRRCLRAHFHFRNTFFFSPPKKLQCRLRGAPLTGTYRFDCVCGAVTIAW